MSLLSIFSDCIKEGHQMHNVNECSLVLKTNNCFLALCTNFNSCWNWWSPASPQACSPLPFTAGMSLQESPIKAWCLINTDVEKKCLSSSTFFFLNSHRNYEKQKLKKKPKQCTSNRRNWTKDDYHGGLPNIVFEKCTALWGQKIHLYIMFYCRTADAIQYCIY